MFLLSDWDGHALREFPGALGIGLDGGYAEFFKAPARNLFRLPESIDFPQGAVIADAVVTAVHAVRRRAKVRDNETVVILGTGGVGQSAIQLARHAGALVIAVVRQAPREAIASKMGAQEVLNSKAVQVPERVKALTEGRGADVVIDNVGTEETVRMALASLRPAGRLVLVGETNDTIPLSTFGLCFNEFEVMGSRSGNRQDTVEASRRSRTVRSRRTSATSTPVPDQRGVRGGEGREDDGAGRHPAGPRVELLNERGVMVRIEPRRHLLLPGELRIGIRSQCGVPRGGMSPGIASGESISFTLAPPHSLPEARLRPGRAAQPQRAGGHRRHPQRDADHPQRTGPRVLGRCRLGQTRYW